MNTENKPVKSNGDKKPSLVSSITLPKGGGAIRNIDQKFTVNPVNGTVSFSIE